jgi:hypothetical protein
MAETLGQPPCRLPRFIFRMRVFVARAGFAGWEPLFGREWMLPITAGRKSGKPRHTLVDVPLHDPESQRASLAIRPQM